MVGGRLPAASASSPLDADGILAGAKAKQEFTNQFLWVAGNKGSRGLWLGRTVSTEQSSEGSLHRLT